ncbi:pyridoxamine 5'-phosphate oxidase family protein [Streptomyces sp. NPDC001852]|uniref:pyridoxamine 5'-phosphate oxidase family protein n=1 Tax=Streptomyces sp. NPDC001852 TaxID=3364619 RepID=UPI0036BD840D
MSTSATALRMVGIPGAEAVWLLEGSRLGRLVYNQQETILVRPSHHVWELGRLIIRTPASAAAIPAEATYHVDDISASTGAGWTATMSGPVEPVTDPDEAAHYRRTLRGWTHGPHDAVLRMQPKTVSGFRLVLTEK